MFKTLKITLILWIALTAQGLMAQTHPQVDFDTTSGKFRLELREDLAPETVKNFLMYVKDGFYTNTIFHRVIGDFMIQGGGMTADFEKKDTRDPIKNEASNGLKNLVGTVAMARTGQPHSATSQFFINVKDNDFLNHRAPSGQNWGYTVFGKVVSGMDVIEKIKQTATTTKSSRQNVPVETILIKSATLVPVEN